jgi:hypothetical protein
MKERKNYEPALKVLEFVGCGAVIGVFISTLVVGCLVEDTTGDLVFYSPFIGAVGGGIITFIIGLIKDIKVAKRNLQSRIERLEEEKKVSLLEEVIGNELYPVQLWAVKELGKIGNEKARLVLKKALKHENRRIRHYAAEALNNLMAERKI